jgi:hypothetical protein
MTEEILQTSNDLRPQLYAKRWVLNIPKRYVGVNGLDDQNTSGMASGEVTTKYPIRFPCMQSDDHLSELGELLARQDRI